jgi:hypothetical protein
VPRETNRYDGAQIQRQLWTPAVLRGSPLALWFAADLSPMTYATGVSQWNDLSGYGRHGTQGTGADQPTFNPNGLSAGRPALVFDALTGNPGFFLPDLSGITARR